MKIVLDMNIPEVWVDFLSRAGHDAIHWSSIGDIRAEDGAIMDWGREHGYVVFTHDLDFGSLLFTTKATGYRFAEADRPRFLACAVAERLPASTRPETAQVLLDAGACSDGPASAPGSVPLHAQQRGAGRPLGGSGTGSGTVGGEGRYTLPAGRCPESRQLHVKTENPG
jgi:hypothetical protein